MHLVLDDPKKVTTWEIFDQIHGLILKDQRISPKSIAEQRGISRERLYKDSSLAIRGSVLREVAPKIKIHHPDPSTERNIKTVRQLEQTFESQCTMLKGRKQQLTSQCFCKGKKHTKKY